MSEKDAKNILLFLCQKHLTEKEIYAILQIVKRAEEKKETTKTIAKEGISLGSVLALVISYVKWKSIAWAIFHSFWGWGYVLYFVVKGYQFKLKVGEVKENVSSKLQGKNNI